MIIALLIGLLAALPARAQPLPGTPPLDTALLVTDTTTLPTLDPDPAAALRSSPAFRAIAGAVASDIEDGKRTFESLRPAYHGATRWFDAAWLTAPETRFVLSAVVHRPDRRLLAPQTCGETRLIYRLERREDLAGGGALPFMMSLIFAIPGDRDCAAYWRALEGASAVAAHPLTRVEINLQSSRWADDGSSHFVDQVRYLMRVFEPDGRGGLAPVPLENTPDAERLEESPRFRQAFLDWLKKPGVLAAIDAGHALVPKMFLTLRAESVTPLTLSRLANRPFSAGLAGADLSSLPLAGFPRLATPAGLLRRLDTLSCVGCHQSASMAGFHVLGQESEPTDGPRLQRPFSPHLLAMQPWREAFSRTQAGIVPDPERVAYAGRPGGPCGLGDAAFSAWTCEAGLVCRAAPALAGSAVGTCIQAAPQDDGDLCERAELQARRRPEFDTLVVKELGVCPRGGVCATTLNGFPSGICSAPCTADTATSRCVAVPALGPFSACRDAGGAFVGCLERFNARTLMHRCLDNAACRPDYICLAVDALGGFCSPPYVAPRLSVEHHPG